MTSCANWRNTHENGRESSRCEATIAAAVEVAEAVAASMIMRPCLQWGFAMAGLRISSCLGTAAIVTAAAAAAATTTTTTEAKACACLEDEEGVYSRSTLSALRTFHRPLLEILKARRTHSQCSNLVATVIPLGTSTAIVPAVFGRHLQRCCNAAPPLAPAWSCC